MKFYISIRIFCEYLRKSIWRHIVLFGDNSWPGNDSTRHANWWTSKIILEFESIWVLEPWPLPAPSNNSYLCGHINIWLANLEIRKEWHEFLYSYTFAAARYDQYSFELNSRIGRPTSLSHRTSCLSLKEA